MNSLKKEWNFNLKNREMAGKYGVMPAFFPVICIY